MKYTLISILLLAAVLGFCIANALAVSSVCRSMEAGIAQAEAEMERGGGGAAELCRSLGEKWERRSRYLDAVSHHEAAGGAETELDAMLSAAEKGNAEDFFIHSSKARSLLEHMRKEERLTLSNIF